jgi:hypothetical protein
MKGPRIFVSVIYLGHLLLKPSDFADISISRILHFVRAEGLPNARAKGCTEDQKWLRCEGNCVACLTILYTPFSKSAMHVCSRHNNLLCYDYMYFLYQNYSQQPALSLSKIPVYFLVSCTVITWALTVLHGKSYCTMRSFKVAPRHILLWPPDQWKWYGWGMWHAWQRKEMHKTVQ